MTIQIYNPEWKNNLTRPRGYYTERSVVLQHEDQSIQAQVSFPSLFITEIIMHTVLMNNEQFVYSTISSITNDELLS